MDIDDSLIFPIDIVAYACQGTRRRRTDVATNQAGFSKANIVWQRTLRVYDVGSVPRPIAQWERIAALFEVVDGRGTGFLLKDPTDSVVAASEGFLRPVTHSGASIGTAGYGFGVPTYRLLKRYTFLSRFKDSDISKPQPGNVSLKRGGAPVTLGAAAGNAAINASTGWVTFVANAQQNVVGVTTGTSTDVELASSVGLMVGDRLWLQDMTGTGAQLLNGASHLITAIDDATYTLDVDTTGSLLNAAGTGRAYPQDSSSLTWTGSFYVPVAFESDEINWQMLTAHPDEDGRLIQSPSIRLEEQRVP
jgi:uncharacterized protein (TIGR02217 family)